MKYTCKHVPADGIEPAQNKSGDANVSLTREMTGKMYQAPKKF